MNQVQYVRNSLAQTQHARNAIQAGIAIVRKVIAADSYPNGLTSNELFKLAVKEPPPPNFQPLDAQDDRIPHPEHPIKSIAFLKRSILPILAGKQEIRMTQVKRSTSSLSAEGALKKKWEQTASGNIWAWMKLDRSTLPKRSPTLTQQLNSSRIGSEVGVGEDWGHLNKRRQSARARKVRRDVERMKAVMEEKQ